MHESCRSTPCHTIAHVPLTPSLVVCSQLQLHAWHAVQAHSQHLADAMRAELRALRELLDGSVSSMHDWSRAQLTAVMARAQARVKDLAAELRYVSKQQGTAVWKVPLTSSLLRLRLCVFAEPPMLR